MPTRGQLRRGRPPQRFEASAIVAVREVLAHDPSRAWRFTEIARALRTGTIDFGQSRKELSRRKVATYRGLRVLVAKGEVMVVSGRRYQIVSDFWSALSELEGLIFGIRLNFENLTLATKHGLPPGSGLTDLEGANLHLQQLKYTMDRFEAVADVELVRLVRAQRTKWESLGRREEVTRSREVLIRELPGSPKVTRSRWSQRSSGRAAD